MRLTLLFIISLGIWACGSNASIETKSKEKQEAAMAEKNTGKSVSKKEKLSDCKDLFKTFIQPLQDTFNQAAAGQGQRTDSLWECRTIGEKSVLFLYRAVKDHARGGEMAWGVAMYDKDQAAFNQKEFWVTGSEPYERAKIMQVTTEAVELQMWEEKSNPAVVTVKFSDIFKL